MEENEEDILCLSRMPLTDTKAEHATRGGSCFKFLIGE